MRESLDIALGVRYMKNIENEQTVVGRSTRKMLKRMLMRISFILWTCRK